MSWDHNNGTRFPIARRKKDAMALKTQVALFALVLLIRGVPSHAGPGSMVKTVEQMNRIALTAGSRSCVPNEPEYCQGFSPEEKIKYANEFSVTFTCQGGETEPVRFTLKRGIEKYGDLNLERPLSWNHSFGVALTAWGWFEEEEKMKLSILPDHLMWFEGLRLNRKLLEVIGQNSFDQSGSFQTTLSLKDQKKNPNLAASIVNLMEEPKASVPDCKNRPLQITIQTNCTMDFYQGGGSGINTAQAAKLNRSLVPFLFDTLKPRD
jgi:hypothetical protein